MSTHNPIDPATLQVGETLIGTYSGAEYRLVSTEVDEGGRVALIDQNGHLSKPLDQLYREPPPLVPPGSVYRLAPGQTLYPERMRKWWDEWEETTNSKYPRVTVTVTPVEDDTA